MKKQKTMGVEPQMSSWWKIDILGAQAAVQSKR